MKKRMSINEFLNGKEQPEPMKVKLERHFKKYRFVYKVVGTTAVMFIVGGGFDYAVFASGDGYTNGSIDKEASIVYRDLVDIGKWLIIGRGGWEVISCVLQKDVDSAKKNFVGYLLAYVLLLSFPHLMDKIDGIFDRFGA